MLIAQRPHGKALAGGWEFPGGKLEPGEQRVRGLARELEEELGLSIRHPRPLVRLTHHYPHARVLLDVFVVRRFAGRLEPRDRQALRWVSRAELESAPLLPADRPILDLLRLPARLARRAARHYRVCDARTLRAAAGRCRAAHVAPGAGGVLLGAWCRSVVEARALAGAADFLVLRNRCADGALERLCRDTDRPVYAAGLSLERAFALGASGVQSIV